MTTLVEQTHFCRVKNLMGVKFPLVSTPLPLDSDDDNDDDDDDDNTPNVM